jgi:hypothetical protein
MTKTITMAIALLAAATLVTAQDVQQTAILINGKSKPIRFVYINKEAYISWADLLQSMPSVFSLSNKGEIVVSPLTTDPRAVLDALNRRSGGTATSGTVIESQIDGDFEGWDGETIFKLTNGQIWQQDEYDYTYEYEFMPDVTIYADGGVWKMKVEGVSDVIRVKRLK